MISNKAKETTKKLFKDKNKLLAANDPELKEIFDNFAFDEVYSHSSLDDKTKMLAILATLLGCQGKELFAIMAQAALNVDVTPVEIKEVVYQAIDYLGMGRVLPFITVMNDVFKDNGIALPLEGQSTTNPDTRLEAGIQAQVDIFGDGMKEFYKTGPEERVHINRWLAANCFGDYYTRNGLDYRQREMITFCFIAAQGGCEPQLTSHAGGNMKVGNDKQFLIDVVSQCVPYIGYPRSLNALTCIENAAKNMEK